MPARKLSYIPITLIIMVGVAWASASLFPDRPDLGFPSLPNTPGTLGYAMSFLDDGTVLSGATLGGTGTDHYLKNQICTLPEVWKGINTSGNPICKGPPLAFAEIYEGSMQVNGTTQTVGYRLVEGDKLETNATQTGTIRFTHNPQVAPAFTPGDSIARLGTGTTVLVDRGDTAGTLALITLQDGLLWGRVLTSTGIDFGGGGVIAGVRGTSIALRSPSENMYELKIPHSQRGVNAGILTGRILVPSVTGENVINSELRSTNFGVLTQSSYYANNDTPLSTLPTFTGIGSRVNLYDSDPWVRTNTLMDITYMRGLAPTPMINGELSATIPPANAKTERQELCSSSNGIWYNTERGCVFAYADNTTGTRMWTNGTDRTVRRSTQVRMNIPAQIGTTSDITSTRFYDNGQLRTRASEGIWNGYQYWSLNNLLSGLPNTISGCQSSAYNDDGREYCIILNQWRNAGWTHLLIRNPSSGTRSSQRGGIWSWNMDNWYHYNYESVLAGIMNPPTTQVFSTTASIPTAATYNAIATIVDSGLPSYNIRNNYEYLQVIGFTSSQLAGKTITIELVNAPVINANSKYLLDLGGVSYYFQSSNLIQRIGTTNTSVTTISGTSRIFELTIPTGITIDRFVIGNNSATSYINPLNNQVQKIIIK